MKRGVGTAKAGGPSFCHYCWCQLQWKPGGGVHYVLLRAPGDHPVRVHHDCKDKAMKDGYKELK